MIVTKVSVIGAGNVGATVAQSIVDKDLADVVLVDIVKGIPQGKGLDMGEGAPIEGYDSSIKGTNRYNDIKNSDIVVITAGLPRKPGMSRDELLEKNAGIIKHVAQNIKKYAKDAVVIVVTNPLDSMVYLTYKVTGFKPNKVMGMAGILDSARFRSFIATELDISVKDIQGLVLGGHGDQMVPLVDYTTVSGIPISKFINKKKMNDIIKRTRKGGGEIVSLLKKGSAFYAPAYSIVQMIDAILNERNRLLPVSAYLNGQYGQKDIFLGVPAILGKNGIKKIIELKLPSKEKALLKESAKHVKSNLSKVKRFIR